MSSQTQTDPDHFSDMVGRWGGLGDEDPPPSPSRHSAGLASRLALLAGRSSPDAERAARADLDLGLATRAQAQEAGHFFPRFYHFHCCALQDPTGGRGDEVEILQEDISVQVKLLSLIQDIKSPCRRCEVSHTSFLLRYCIIPAHWT